MPPTAAREFDDARTTARRELVAVAIGAGVVIVLLLITAQDVVRLALERRETLTRDVILTVGLLLAAGLAARVLADLLRIPEIVLLIAIGALLGPSVLDVVDVPLDSLGAQLLFTFGVSSILFYGGLNLSLTVLRQVARQPRAARDPGRARDRAADGRRRRARVRAAVRAGAADRRGALADRPGDPDPAVRRLAAAPALAQTVIAESAFNDPTGAVLALAIAGALLSGESGIGGPASSSSPSSRSAPSSAFSPACCCRRRSRAAAPGILRDSAPIAVLAVVAVSYVSLDFAGGSGYLGAFLAGLIVGNMELLGLVMHSHNEDELRISSRTLSEVVTIFVFLVVGASLPFATLADNWAPSLAVVAVLLLVARPVAVLACTLPDRRARWTRPELAFLCWTRETGVVPAALVGVLAGLGVPNIDLLAGVVALAIVATLLLQAAPAPWLARRLGLLDPAPTPPG